MRVVRPLIIKLRVVKKGYWDFSEDIPLLSVGTHPSMDKQRVKEEINTFNIWRKYNPTIPFKNLRYVGGNIFIVDVDCYALFGKKCGKHKELSISIICPPTYPRAMPMLAENPRYPHDRLFRRLLAEETHHAVYMCIPAIQRYWWYKNMPYAGIAHFLNIFLIWFSITSKSKEKTKISFYEKKSVFV